MNSIYQITIRIFFIPLLIIFSSSTYVSADDNDAYLAKIFNSVHKYMVKSDYFDGGRKETWEVENTGKREILQMDVSYMYGRHIKDAKGKDTILHFSKTIHLKNIIPKERKRFSFYIDHLNSLDHKHGVIVGYNNVKFKEQ